MSKQREFNQSDFIPSSDKSLPMNILRAFTFETKIALAFRAALTWMMQLLNLSIWTPVLQEPSASTRDDATPPCAGA